MKKIENLTPVQIELMGSTVKEWLDVLSKQEIEKQPFENGIKWVYEKMGKPMPKIVYCDSWHSALITIAIWKKKASVGDSVRDSVWASVRASIRASVWASVGASVGDSVRASVWASVCASVRASVWDSVWDSVRASVWDSVWASVWDYSYSISLYEYARTAFYSYFKKIGVFKNKDFDIYEEMLNSGIFITYCYENVVFAVHPATKILRDEQGNLNSIEGKAFEFRDGTGLYSLNGFTIPEDLFLSLKNETYTVKMFFNERNEEIKSAVISFIQQTKGEEGVFRFFESSMKKVDDYVDAKEDIYMEGTTKGMNIGVYSLFKGEINNTKIAYVRCYCPSTDRMFFLGVEPKHNNAKDAIASLYQCPAILVNNIVSISRQGEKFSTTFDEETTKALEQNLYSNEQLSNYVSLSGDKYFELMNYEF